MIGLWSLTLGLKIVCFFAYPRILLSQTTKYVDYKGLVIEIQLFVEIEKYLALQHWE